jgi:[ribosomal protein S5]-alanine N-acetyltransferase
MQENTGLLFQTTRLVLREIREDDWEAVHEYGSDPEVVKYMLFGPNSLDDTRAFIERALANQKAQPRLSYNFALITKNDDKLIGSCELRIENVGSKEGEIGYILNRKYWNRGYMTEAAIKAVSFGFEQLGLHRIFATCHPANKGSYHVMEKIGMQREGQIRSHRFIKGEWRDSLLYSILENEWHAGK